MGLGGLSLHSPPPAAPSAPRRGCSPPSLPSQEHLPRGVIRGSAPGVAAPGGRGGGERATCSVRAEQTLQSRLGVSVEREGRDPACPGGRRARPLAGAGPDSVELSSAWRAAGRELLSFPR